jgi:hypothetical protein
VVTGTVKENVFESIADVVASLSAQDRCRLRFELPNPLRTTNTKGYCWSTNG